MAGLDFIRKIINVKDYENLVYEYNGRNVWDKAFNEAYNHLTDGSVLLIPDGIYEFENRSIMRGKNNITVFCEGILMPVSDISKVPLIGLMMIHNCHNSTFNSLSFDGNKNNVKPSSTLGKQSMIELNDSTNITFNNLQMVNTSESAFNSNGNIDNVIFNNVYLEEIGEHGFYFGGSDTKNVKFNNIYCKNIGMNEVNKSRNVAMIKLRNKKEDDILHDNIVVDGFTFISETKSSHDRQVLQGFDTKTATVKNGTVVGADTSLLGGNLQMDSIVFDNIEFNGRRIAYGINHVYGWDKTDDMPVIPNITDTGKMNNQILNSRIIMTSNHAYFNDFALYSNCSIDFGGYQFNDSMSGNVNRVCKFDSCELILGNGRIDVTKATDCKFIFNNIIFNSYAANRGQDLIINKSTGNSFVLNDVVIKTPLPYFIQTTSEAELFINQGYINSGIRTTNSNFSLINIQNAYIDKYLLSTKAAFTKLFANRVCDLDGNRKDYIEKLVIIPAGETSVKVDMKNDRMYGLTADNITLSTTQGVDLSKTVNADNVVISLDEAQTQDVVITIIYNANI